MRTHFLFLSIVILLIAGCARPYRKINMSAIPFKEYHQGNKISYSERQGVLYNMKNFFYAKREMKNDLSLIAFKIANTSPYPIMINDLQFTCGASVPMTPIKMDEFYAILKQKAALYWLYSAGFIVYPKPAVMTVNISGTPVQVNQPDNPKKLIKNGKQYIPIPFGLPIAAANYGIAYRSNKKLNADLKLLDLSNRMIQPGDTIQGVLPFRGVANCGDIFISVKGE